MTLLQKNHRRCAGTTDPDIVVNKSMMCLFSCGQRKTSMIHSRTAAQS